LGFDTLPKRFGVFFRLSAAFIFNGRDKTPNASPSSQKNLTPLLRPQKNQPENERSFSAQPKHAKSKHSAKEEESSSSLDLAATLAHSPTEFAITQKKSEDPIGISYYGDNGARSAKKE